MKKKARIGDGQEDRISKLPDDVIHKIMYHLNSTKLAVRTSILSNRWKLVWKTLPFPFFKERPHTLEKDKIYKFVSHVFSHRNHDSNILSLVLHEASIPEDLLGKCVKYAISHNVQDLTVYIVYKFELSIFRSCYLKSLKLWIGFENLILGETNSWDFPALTTLQLINTSEIVDLSFLEAFLVSLPSLRDLLLHKFVISNPLSLPSLKALTLLRCDLVQTRSHLPALVSLKLNSVTFPNNMKEFFSAFVSLQNLKLVFGFQSYVDCVISCPQLLNLEIGTSYDHISSVNILVFAPKLRNFESAGLFRLTCGVSSLEKVSIKLHNCIKNKNMISLKKLKRYYHRLAIMLPGLGSAKILTLDLETIEALSEVSNLLGQFPSPFYNLKYVKLPNGYKESNLSTTIKSYLLGGSPGAIIVTTLPKNDVLTYMASVSLTAPKVVYEGPLATASKELIDSQDIPKKARVSNYVMWQGYEVNPDFVDVLDFIMKKYPETFENFTSKSKLCTMKLNILCTSVNDFRKTSMTEVSREMIAEYRELFSHLQQSFNVKWLVRHLNYIEQLRFPNLLLQELHAIESSIGDTESSLKDLQTRVDDAERILQELHTCRDGAQAKLKDLKKLRSEMMMAIEDASENMDTTFAASAGCIGDDVFSGL